MIDRFLKAKHWQLFLIIFGIPMISQFIAMGRMMSNMLSHQPPYSMIDFMAIFPLIMAIVIGVLFGWFWSIAIGLQKLIPHNVELKVKRFKIFLFIPLTYMCLINVFILFTISGIMDRASPNGIFIGSILAFVIPLHLFSIFCMFHTLYFVAKTIKTAELQREVTFSDYAGEFFLIWFFPIGIWFVQPKINKLIKN